MTSDYTLNDFRALLDSIQKMGRGDLVAGMGAAGANCDADEIEANLARFKRIIDTMTPEERLDPSRISAKAMERIASTADAQRQQVDELIKQFSMIRDTMRHASNMTLWQRLKLAFGFTRFPPPPEAG